MSLRPDILDDEICHKLKNLYQFYKLQLHFYKSFIIESIPISGIVKIEINQSV